MAYGLISFHLKKYMARKARIYVPRSAHESSLAPRCVFWLNTLAITPSSISETRLIVIKMENNHSFLSMISQRINGKITILYRESILGMVQNLSVAAVLVCSGIPTI